jgi:hypothetical protein
MKNKIITVIAVWVCSLFVISPVLGNVLVNPNFNQGANFLTGYEAFAVWNQPAGPASFQSPWDLADAPVTADGSGTAVFGMNTGLASRDAFWSGATQEMNFLQSLWTPDNNAGVTPTVDLYNQKITFSGTVNVTEAFASGNTSVAFIQFLDGVYGSTGFFTADVTSSGNFSIDANAPASGLNIIQVGFRNSGIEGTAGEIEISNLSLVAVPEPATVGLFGLGALGAWIIRRNKAKAIEEE